MTPRTTFILSFIAITSTGLAIFAVLAAVHVADKVFVAVFALVLCVGSSLCSTAAVRYVDKSSPQPPRR